MSQKKKEFDFLVQQARKSLPAKSPDGLVKMLEILCQKINEEDLEFFDSQILSEMAVSHWEMAKERGKGEPKLRIYSSIVEGREYRKTIIDIVSDDLAFLVDSIAAEINRHNILIGILIHPNVYSSYDQKGDLKEITPDAISDDCHRQAHIHVQINETLSEQATKKLQDGLYATLNDVFYANSDWRPMLEKLKKASSDLNGARTHRPAAEIQEYCAFLDYLYDNNFTLLGYREYKFIDGKNGVYSRTVRGSSLGLLHNDVSPAYITETEEGLPRNLQELRRKLPPVSVSKTNRLATVHRRVPMDCIAVKVYNENGDIVGEKLFLGLLTSVTYSRSVSDVPYLCAKVEDTIDISGYIEGTHDCKALRHILEKYPRDELFQMEPKELLKVCRNIIRLQERQRIALFMRMDPFGRYISCLVYIPRDRFGTAIRQDIQAILEEETHGRCSNFYTTLDDSVFARVMFVINVSQKDPPKIAPKRIEQRLRDCGQTWAERLSQALGDAYEDYSKITDLTFRYADAFPVSYTSTYKAKRAVFDIEKIEAVLESGSVGLDLYRPNNIDLNKIRLKMFQVGSPVILSDVLPILEDMGLRVIAELPYEVTPSGADKSVWIHDFLLETPEIEGFIVVQDVKENFERAFIKVWDKQTDNDGLNRLVLNAGSNWHEIIILRAYVRYIKQLRFPFSRTYIENVLTTNPTISRLLIDMFKAYHDPKNRDESEALVDACKDQITRELDQVESSDSDRILRTLVELIHATIRTNYFQKQEDGSRKPCLSLKFDCSQISDMPLPKPFREVFVFSSRVEALHLRGDKIARGGLRWSDRHEDYRTEVLGLMKAQMVKNSVIVPVGSKGGFIVKTPTNGRAEFMAEGIECYKIFIRGLLDITDNQSGKKIIPPKDMVRRDGDDPYLVVAADKGTATFSDIANGLSQEYGFWLDDAFASGGSAGYDHKKMGITARGAWESVKYHFRLFNHNIQEKPFDVVGVGDMGGDVFGNGMLLSEHIHLIGAFNHLHIFCDPDPDPVTSFAERRRLFESVGGWDQYNTKLLSKGGCIFKRSSKMLKLTPEIKKRFDLEDTNVTPDCLIRAMLKSRTDLLWFGGIGTYIKATKETDADVGDKASDSLRVDASEVRAKVIGEGANLGITQLARIEMSERGVSINTDFLDNSAGVDSSDHEVNIKILMRDVMEQKDHGMDLAARNKLLEKMTSEIASHVLRHNYQQAQAISLMEMQAPENIQLHDEFIRDMEREEGLSREIEGLPDQSIITERLRLGKGLTRPELCIIFAYAKINLTQDLLNSDIPDSPEMNYWIMDYFPEILGKKYEKEILRHRLKREIIATMMANSLINRMGPTFLKSRMNKTGATVDDIARAYIVVRDAFGLRRLWDSIEALDGTVPAQVQLKAMREIGSLSEYGITWFLTRLGRDLDIDKDAKEFGAGVKTLSQNLDQLVTENLLVAIGQREDAAMRDGLPKDIARQISLMPILFSACDIIRIALEQKVDLKSTARVYFQVGERFHLDWLRQKARFLPQGDHWKSEAAKGLMGQLYGCQAGLTVRILRDVDKKPKGKSLVDVWLEKHAHHVAQLDPLFADLHRVGTIDLVMLTVVEQRLRGLYGG
ncbi:MAG: glutamate dehydrogenase [Zetaproteobacteria bacterium]|nr:MAG: glutamate dehydrogenase [Zetaproteobacteria bacterium]